MINSNQGPSITKEPSPATRVRVVMVICAMLAGAVLSKAVTVQLVGDPRLAAMAKRQFQSKVLIRPRRGLITDRNGEPLAINTEVQSLAANPSKVKNLRSLARTLARATGMPISRITEKLTVKPGEKREFVWIKRHLTPEELKRFEKLRIIDREGDLVEGLWLIKESKRVYPHNELAAHVLGSVNLDSEGLEGMELLANEPLRGKVASVSAVKDALGRPAFIDPQAAQGLREGERVELTLDASLQYSIEQELKAAVARTGSRSGTVIVMNAENGEILGMANEPSFNPNAKGVPAAARRNRAITDGYEPGSTMKPILIAAALSHGAKLTDAVHGEHGSFTVQGKTISEAESHERWEWINLKRIIQVSSNVGAAKVGLHLGADKLYAALKSFGFGSRTGVNYPGEISGKVPPRKAWTPLATANISFGQGLLVTPIQMARAYAVFANGGYLVQPTLLRTPIDPHRAPPVRILNPRALADTVTALQSVTEDEGTGVKARIDGYEIAGKTGTAQVVDPNTGRYSRTRYLPSFIGFAKGVDPKIVVFASLDDPRGVYYAAETAVPLFRAVMEAVTNRFSVPANHSRPVTGLAESSPSEKEKGASVLSDRLRTSLAKVDVVTAPPATSLIASVEAGENGPIPESERAVAWEGTGPGGAQLWKMPALRGLGARRAISILRGHEFQLELHGSGVVKSQTPEPGRTLADGATVKLTLEEP